MSTEARMQPDPFERLRSALENASLSHEFLAEYVTELSPNGVEEEIFRRLAPRSLKFGEDGASSLIVSAFSESYEAMGLADKTELRRWWHKRLRREAYQHDDLRARLSWRYLV